MKVLFIGGTGIISSACSKRAIETGVELFHLNRGKTLTRKIIGVNQLIGDIRRPEDLTAILKGHRFDAVVDFIAFVPEHIQNDIQLFSVICDQYIFISSASAYQTPPVSWPLTESTPLINPFWPYSQQKIACENILMDAFEKKQFPATIVRPSHTYDKTLIPLEGGYTQLARLKQGKPAVVHGDGSSLWTLTHHSDFAIGLVGLLGKKEAIGQDYHITSEEALSWDRIFTILSEKMGVEPNLKHIPSDFIARYSKEMGESLLGDKTHSLIFDNSKIKGIVPEFDCRIPFEKGAGEIIQWYEEDRSRQVIDPNLDRIFDRICSDFDSIT